MSDDIGRQMQRIARRLQRLDSTAANPAPLASRQPHPPAERVSTGTPGRPEAAVAKPRPPPQPRRRARRKPQARTADLAIFGGAWLHAHGLPAAAAPLERALGEECRRRGWARSTRQTRQLAGRLVAAHAAALAARPGPVSPAPRAPSPSAAPSRAPACRTRGARRRGR